MMAFLLGTLASLARADDAGTKDLPCAVEGSLRPLRAAEVCRALGRELARSVTLVDDARRVARGDAVQLIHDDVQWAVIWLVDGRIRSWTRVSKLDAIEEQMRFLARAVRAVAKAAATPEKSCVRLDPNAGRKMRSADLTYPWAELRPCKRRSVEVVDPWWVAERPREVVQGSRSEPRPARP